MDIFCEQLTARKKTFKDAVIIAGIILAAAIGSLLLLLALKAFSFMFIFIVWYGAWWLITRRSAEYEYIITSTVLDVDKIMGKRVRKRLLSVNLREAERFMPICDMPNMDIKIIDATPNGIEEGVYGVDFTSDGQAKRLLFKPNKKILNSAKTASPSLVILRREDIEE